MADETEATEVDLFLRYPVNGLGSMTIEVTEESAKKLSTTLANADTVVLMVVSKQGLYVIPKDNIAGLDLTALAKAAGVYGD